MQILCKEPAHGYFDPNPHGCPKCPAYRISMRKEADDANFRKRHYAPRDADREWVKTQIGDVPYDRIVGLDCHDNPISWGGYGFNLNGEPYVQPMRRTPDYFGETVPVESLVRERNDCIIAMRQQQATHNAAHYRKLRDELVARGPLEWVPK